MARLFRIFHNLKNRLKFNDATVLKMPQVYFIKDSCTKVYLDPSKLSATISTENPSNNESPREEIRRHSKRRSIKDRYI